MSTTSPYATRRDDSELVAAVRAGDERAFLELAATHHSALRRVALAHGCGAAADAVVHQTWREVLSRLDRFDGRPTLRAWAGRIASGCARARDLSGQGLEPFASLPRAAAEPGEPALDDARFLPPDHPEFPWHWAEAPAAWELPAERALPAAARRVMAEAVEWLPPAQQLVVTLRDVEGWTTQEVSDAFDVSEGDVRVLLHRGRSSVRAALERWFDDDDRGR
jgi:RNA polymerase sigma-70 factor (ECF subfamily)